MPLRKKDRRKVTMNQEQVMINKELCELISDPESIDLDKSITQINGIHYQISNNGVLCRNNKSSEKEHYAESFGLEWQHFKHVQADSAIKTTKSADRLERLMGRPLEFLKGKTVLEIGPGGGRFTEILVKYAKYVICIEPSSAANINIASPNSKLMIIQDDLELNPISANLIDVVFCRGVIQHAPEPMKFIDLLFKSVRDEGWVFFDFYRKKRWYTNPKYWYRPITKRLNKELMLKLCKRFVPPLSILKWKLEDWGLDKRITFRLFPINDARGQEGFTNEEHWIASNILNTFDDHTPTFDHPPSQREVLSYLITKGYWAQADLVLSDWRAKKVVLPQK